MTESEELVLLLCCKVTLILGIIASLTLVAGRRWPQSCTIWQRFGVLTLLPLPVAVWTLPAIGIPVLSAPGAAFIAGDVMFGPSLSADASSRLPDGPLSAAEASQSRAGAHRLSSRGLPTPNIRFFGIAAILYCFVVMALAIRFVRAWVGLNQLKRASSPVDDLAWKGRVVHWSTVLGVTRRVELRTSEDVSVPMTFGWRVPVILVPGDCISTCDETQREAIIIHELTHIAHGDFFWQAMIRLTASLYWLHPLMWLIRRQDGTLCERICDALCSRHLTRESYAQALVQIAGRKVLRPAGALGMAMARASSLGRRLNDLQASELSPYSQPNRVQRAVQGAAAGIILGLIAVGTLSSRVSALGEEKKAASKAENAKNGAKEGSALTIRLPEKIEGQIVDDQDKPLAKATVVIGVVSNDAAREPDLPKPWTATTDERGRYSFSTNRQMLGPDDFFSLKIQAEGFAERMIYYQAIDGAKGSLPVQRLHAARKIQGRLVDPEGRAVADAVVRFQAGAADFSVHYDSGPLPVDKAGKFSAWIPKAGKAAFAVYPRDFAPQIVDVPDAGNPDDGADVGPIRVASGTSLTGRVVDKQGRGVAGTVVAIQGEEEHRLALFHIMVATAVKTDENGGFTLPPVRGIYKVWVTGDAPDYSRRIVVTGAKPPPILPERMTFDGKEKTEEIEFREAVSVIVRGSVRWPDGSAVPNVEISSSILPPGWHMGVNLASARTDAEGNYALKLPSPAQGVHLSVAPSLRAPNGAHRQFKATGTGADVRNQNRTIRFDVVDGDVEGADWVVDVEE